jgi:hypothetical protein
MPAAIPIVIAAATSALSAGLGGASAAGIWAAAAVGAALAGIGLLIKPSQPNQKAERAKDEKVTLSTRNAVVPVQFGRGRLAGNVVIFGNFHEYLSNRNFFVYECHMVVAFCEGEVRVAGNPNIGQFRRVDRNNEIEANEKPTALSRRYWNKFVNYYGNNTDTVQWMLLDDFSATDDHLLGNIYELSAGFTHEVNGERVLVGSNQPPVPYRNTFVSMIQAHSGSARQLVSVTQDLVGHDQSLVIAGTDSGSNFSEVATGGGYDAHTESFWYTFDDTPQLVIVRYDRRGSDRSSTRQPSADTGTSKYGWYLGRHDIVLFQDSGDDEVFYFGYWGITQGSGDWERYRPSPFYSEPILGHHLDELNGVLHTLHDDGSVRYAMQMHLLTGRIDKIDLDLDPITTVSAFSYSSDLSSYIVLADTVCYLVDRQTGNTYASTEDLDAANPKGLFSSGTFVGLVTTAGVYLWDHHQGVVTGPFGSNASTTADGQFGSTVASKQNTWTGHVTVIKTISGTAAMINFVPSVRERVDDVSAMGSPGGDEFQWLPAIPAGTDYDPDTNDTTGWFRDWSYRTYNSWSLSLFEGVGNLAGGALSALIDESTVDAEYRDFGRWGCGLDADWIDISSFESVNSRCVAGWRYKNQARPLSEGSASDAGTDFAPVTEEYRYAERYKFDFSLEESVNAAEFLVERALACCNGYKTVYDGRLRIGIELPGQMPVWHLNESAIAADSASLPFVSRSGQANRIRCQYRDLRNNYKLDWVQADNEFDQIAYGRVTERVVALDGIVRKGQAELIAQQVQDQAAMRSRALTVKTGFLGFAFSPGDVVEVTHRSLGVSRLPFRLMSTIQSGKVWEVQGAEFRPVLLNLRDSGSPLVSIGSIGSVVGSGQQPGSCETAEGSVGSGVVWFNGGAQYGAGLFVVYYIEGAYMLTDDGGYCVDGYEFVTLVDGVITAIMDAPAVSNPVGGWETPEEAVVSNAGQASVLTLGADGPIGLRLKDPPKFTNWGAYGAVEYQLCLNSDDDTPETSDSGGGEPLPADCDEAASGAEDSYILTFSDGEMSGSSPVTMWDDGTNGDVFADDGSYGTNDAPLAGWARPTLECALDYLDTGTAFVGWYIKIITVGLGAGTYGYAIKPDADNPYGVIQQSSPEGIFVLTYTTFAGSWNDAFTVTVVISASGGIGGGSGGGTGGGSLDGGSAGGTGSGSVDGGDASGV